MHRFLVIAVIVGLCTYPLVASGWSQEVVREKPPAKPRLLPGIQPGGAVLLPNQWSLRPAGKQLVLGDFPVNIALHLGGQWLAVLHAGYGPHEVVIVDGKSQKIVSRVTLDQAFYGLCFSPDGRQLFASGGEFEVVHAFDFADGLLSRHRRFPVAKPAQKFIPAGLAIDATGRLLFAAGPWGHAVCIVPLDAPDQCTAVAVGKESYPYACAVDREGKRLFVSLWNRAAVAVIASRGG